MHRRISDLDTWDSYYMRPPHPLPTLDDLEDDLVDRIVKRVVWAITTLAALGIAGSGYYFYLQLIAKS